MSILCRAGQKVVNTRCFLLLVHVILVLASGTLGILLHSLDTDKLRIGFGQVSCGIFGLRPFFDVA